jgi:hypothetical protein
MTDLSEIIHREAGRCTATVRVSASMIEVNDALSLGPPKSRAGQRTVAFPRQLLDELARHLGKHAERGPRGRVFVGPKGATPRRTNFNRAWQKATAKAGVEGLRFHDLRHTANTMAAPGSSTRELMRRMGHASTRTAMIYQHASDDRDRVIADTIGAAIEEWHDGQVDDDGGPAGFPGARVGVTLWHRSGTEAPEALPPGGSNDDPEAS